MIVSWSLVLVVSRRSLHTNEWTSKGGKGRGRKDIMMIVTIDTKWVALWLGTRMYRML